MTDGSENEAARLRRENRRALIDRLNAKEEYLTELEGRRREPGKLTQEELANEIERERERNLSRLGFGQIGGGSF